MSDAASGQLAQRSLTAVKWSYFGVLIRVIAQLLAQIALARMLGPETFGLFAAVLLVLGVGNLFVESGIGAVLIQSKSLPEDHRSAACRAVLINALVVSGMVFWLRDSLAIFFSERDLSEVLGWVWPAFFLHALSIAPMALLRRDLDFKSIQIIQVLGYLIGFLFVGVLVAWMGAGVWSLVAAWLTQATVTAVLANYRRPCFPRSFKSKESLWMHPFGVRVLLTNLVNWFIENIDNVIVGRFFGSASLGLYSVSYNFVRNPTNHLVTSLQAVLFPASARSQDDNGRLVRAYLTAVSGISLVAFPVFATVAAVSESVTLAMFGSKWMNAASILTPLSLAMPLHALMAVAGPVLWGKGIAGLELKVQALTGVLLALSLFFASTKNVVVVGWVVLAVYFLRWLGMTNVLAVALGMTFSSLFRVLRGPLALSFVLALILAYLDSLFFDFSPMRRFLADVFIAAALFFFLILSFPSFFISYEIRHLILRLLGDRQGVLNSWLFCRVLLNSQEIQEKEGHQS